MIKRIALATLAIPAMVATAAPAHAAGLTVEHNQTIAGMQVVVREATGVEAKQDCSYDAIPQQPSLLLPAHRNFVLGVQGVVQWENPGLPTGTKWDVSVLCAFSSPAPPGAQPGSFSEVVTY
jgi:hypothetical protein